MVSLNKLAVLIAVTGAVVYGARLVERVNAVRHRAVSRRAGRGDAAARRWMQGESLKECPSCGVYVSRNANCACGRNAHTDTQSSH